jgi:hypothetical protein
MNCKNMISPQNTYRFRMPDTSINSRSSVTQHLCWDVSSCHSGIEWKWTQQILEQFWPYVEHVPSVTQNYIPLSETDWGWKNQVSSFSSHKWVLLKIQKGKWIKWLMLISCIILTHRWLRMEHFSVDCSINCTEKRLAYVRKWWG